MTEVYNRYVAKPDGTFQKTKLPENVDMNEKYTVPESPTAALPSEGQQSRSSCREKEPLPIGSFVKNLLPHGLDTEDLIVILLLLLLSQDGGKNGNRALLTLGAYLFL